jgi:DNA adenine methylase
MSNLHPVRTREPKPLLRWAGSKRKLLSELVTAVPLEFSTYIEPFAGSACLFFHLQPERAILGDINPELIGFYRATRKHPHKVLQRALRCPRTESGYYITRVRYIAERDATSRASFFLFLNRFCFNGIFRTNTKGDFNVPFGTRTGAFPSSEEFRNAANLLKRATLLCSDFEQVLHRAKEGDFAYLDPPYVYRTRKDRGEYGPDSFSLSDIARLRSAIENLDQRSVRFLLSYLDCDEIRPISNQFNCRTVPVARTVAGLTKARQVVNELLISNF